MGNDVSTLVAGNISDIAKGVDDINKQLTEGVGAVGQSIGDLFFFDNPHRRDRVDQLKQDINSFKAEFDDLKGQA